jgi:hypothetical protein
VVWLSYLPPLMAEEIEAKQTKNYNANRYPDAGSDGNRLGG